MISVEDGSNDNYENVPNVVKIVVCEEEGDVIIKITYTTDLHRYNDGAISIVMSSFRSQVQIIERLHIFIANILFAASLCQHQEISTLNSWMWIFSIYSCQNLKIKLTPSCSTILILSSFEGLASPRVAFF